MKRRFLPLTAVLLLAAACSRETPDRASTASAPPVSKDSAATSAPAPVIATKSGGTYDGAMTWLRSTPAFRFVIDEAGVHAEGTMTRSTVGAEIVEFRANDQEWRGSAGVKGVTWEKRSSGTWSPAEPPPFANRLYQRVTVAFDPQKKEGEPQLVEHDAQSNHYRFTNANTGEVHDVRVSRADDHVERITIGTSMDLQLTPLPPPARS